MAKYVLGASREELERLRIQSALFEKQTMQTLNLAGIQNGMRCLDVGCGAGHTSLLMSRLVGQSGHVLGMDISEDIVDTCNRKIKSNDSNLILSLGIYMTVAWTSSSFDLCILIFIPTST